MIEHRSPQSGIASLGSWVATAGYDNQVILWDRRTRSALARGNHDHLVNSCRFTADGTHLLTASSDHTARRWSLPDLKLQAVYGGHDDDVEAAVPHPRDGRVATASRDHHIRVFGEDGGLRATCTGHRADVLSVEWIRDGRELLSSGDDGTVRRWDGETGRLLHTLDLGPVEADTVVHHDALDLTIAGTDAGELVVAHRGGEPRTVAAHGAGIKRLAIDPAAGLLLSTSYDRTVRVWRLGDGAFEAGRSFDAPPAVWLRAATIVDEQTVAFGTFGSSYALLDLHDGTWHLDGVQPTPGINAVRVVGDTRWTVGDAGIVAADAAPVLQVPSLCNFIGTLGDQLVVGGQTGELFEVPSGRVLLRHRSPLNCSVSARIGDEDCLVIGTYTGEAIVLRVRDGRPWRTLPLHTNAVKGMAVQAGRLFSVSATAAVAVHDLTSGACLRQHEHGHDQIANSAAAVPGGFVSVSRDRTLRLFASDGEHLDTVETPHTHSIKCVAAHPDEAVVATGAYDGTVGVLDLAARAWTGFARPTWSGISSLCWDPTRSSFLASSYDGEVYELTLTGRAAPVGAAGSVQPAGSRG